MKYPIWRGALALLFGFAIGVQAVHGQTINGGGSGLPSGGDSAHLLEGDNGTGAWVNVLPNPFTASTQALHDISQDVANSAFVAQEIAGINQAVAVNEATAAVLPNTPTYANGTAGVGATLTAGANAALVVDGVTVAANDRILVKNQASALQNGVYTVTTAGNGSTPWVLTRATDYNAPTNIDYTGLIPAIAGTANANTYWQLTTPVVTVGTSALNYTQDTTGGTSGKPGNVKAAAALTKYQVIIGQGGASVAALGSIGTSNQVLTSNGPGAAPSWQTPAAGVTCANPTASVGLTAGNGSSANCMRADAAPPLDQSIAPTWTGYHNHSAGAKITPASPPATNEIGYLGAPINEQDGSAYTFVIGDAGKMIRSANSGAATYTIPTNASVAFPLGTVIVARNAPGSTNNLTVSPAGGVNLYQAGVTFSASVVLSPGQIITLTKEATNDWSMTGNSGFPISSASTNANEGTSSTSYTDLTTSGPSVTLTTTGTTAVVWLSAVANRPSGSGNTSFVSVAVSGASTVAASDGNSGQASPPSAGFSFTIARSGILITGLTPGSNTFKLQYRVDGGTTVNFTNRSLAVFAP